MENDNRLALINILLTMCLMVAGHLLLSVSLWLVVLFPVVIFIGYAIWGEFER